MRICEGLAFGGGAAGALYALANWLDDSPARVPRLGSEVFDAYRARTLDALRDRPSADYATSLMR